MPIVYREVELTPRGRVLGVRLLLANDGPRDWTPAADFLGWQIYDAATELLVREGPRRPLLAPAGQRVEAEIEIEFPEQDGRFRVFVSPLTEGQGWFFERGEPLAVIEAEVRGGALRRASARVTTLRGLAWRRFGRALGRAFVYPLRSMWRNRSLIRSMVRRDIAGRYAGSYGGVFWTAIHPLLMMLTYWFVFGLVLRTRFGDDGRPSNFVLYFLAGMLPWLAFSEAAGRAPTIVWEHANFVKKLVFPIEILPVNLTAAGLFSQAFALAIFFGGMLAFGREPAWTALWVPVLLVPQALLTLGVGWFLAALGVLFRDLGQFNGFLLTVWFFTTPICYPESALPEEARWLFELNPMYVLVRAYRAVLLEGSAPETGPLAALVVGSGAAFLFGYAWFHRLKKQFADIV